MNTYTRITANIFTAVKLLLENGATNEECAKYMKISKGSVGNIKAAENFDEYRAIVAAVSAKKKAKKQKADEVAKQVGAVPASKLQQPTQVVEHRQSVQITATHFMDTKLDKIIELLTVMNAKMGAIIDDLYGTGTKGDKGVG